MNTPVRCRQAVILLCNKDAVLHTQLLNLHINELIRQGFEDIILLTSQAELPQCISTRRCTIILAEGQVDSDALRNAAGFLNDQFLLVHGDCFFDFNYRALEAVQRHTEGIMVTMALKAGMGRSRFSYASVLDGKVTGLSTQIIRSIDHPTLVLVFISVTVRSSRESRKAPVRSNGAP
ncbi:hypothetical protein [Kordiimonas gwangyangensis]|uniref:hypothetical protein n=1 Tax=Kordiimonas gwangyangensis TaxID=288022 RepID=UPI000471BFA2|nr:hypothetical protein [Kordiimonas gwangyangensis]